MTDKKEALRSGAGERLMDVLEVSALSKLRHLYKNMVSGGVKDASEAKRIAEGLLSPAIAVIESLHAEVEALRGGWIPVTERLPEDGLQVWIAYHWGTENAPKDYEHQGYAIWSNGDWFFDVTESADLYSRQQAVKDGLDAAVVYAWRPLPTPPAQEGGK